MSKAPPPVSQRELHRVCLINFVCILLETQLEWVWDYVTHLTPPVLHSLEARYDLPRFHLHNLSCKPFNFLVTLPTYLLNYLCKVNIIWKKVDVNG